MEELGPDVPAFANIMAITLAVLHWETRIDAEDVEFVLGSRPLAVYNEAPLSPNSNPIPSLGTRDTTKSSLFCGILRCLKYTKTGRRQAG